MGWGTFIAGRILNQRSRGPSLFDEAEHALDNYLLRRTELEIEVLEEISRLKSQGLPIDLEKVREEIQVIRKARRHMGTSLRLKVVREAQEKILAGEEVNYSEIEREVLSKYKPFNFERFLKPFFPDYFKFKKFLKKFLSNRF